MEEVEDVEEGHSTATSTTLSYADTRDFAEPGQRPRTPMQELKPLATATKRVEKGDIQSPLSMQGATPNPFYRQHTSVDIDDYFFGPRDIDKHSKWPLPLQMQGSILPNLVLPLLLVGGWATTITAISKLVPHVSLGVNNIILTVTGFVVGLALSFRSTTAYERYAEGRKIWSQLVLGCQTMGRLMWIHATERPGSVNEDLLGKLTGMNLLIAFAVSLKHKIRFEPYTHYEDIEQLVAHLDTFAQAATQDQVPSPNRRSVFKAVGEHLGLSFTTSNPRKYVKRATEPLGNLPLEILSYLSAYIDDLVDNGQLHVSSHQTMAYGAIASMNDVLVNADRVSNTPLPIAYTIAIAQVTWLYVFLLPFQLYNYLGWVTIPGTLAGAYIILGLLFIGQEVENPFGNDVNDLPLDRFCYQIVQDLETISAKPRPKVSEFIHSDRNRVLFPMSQSTYGQWKSRPESSLRRALRNRPYFTYAKKPRRTALQNQSVLQSQNALPGAV